MQYNVNHTSTNANQKYNFDDRRSYNDLPLMPGECLIPIVAPWEMVRHFKMNPDNMETWHYGSHKVPIAFAPVKLETKAANLKNFNADVREYLRKDVRFDELSLDAFLDAAESENDSGYDPTCVESFEEEVLLSLMLDDLIKEVSHQNHKYGRIIELLRDGYSKGEILTEMNLGRSQGYDDIRKAQNLAKELYYKG